MLEKVKGRWHLQSPTIGTLHVDIGSYFMCLGGSLPPNNVQGSLVFYIFFPSNCEIMMT